MFASRIRVKPSARVVAPSSGPSVFERIKESISEEPDSIQHGPIPIDARRSPVTMSLLWITMVTGLPCLLMGFEWYKSGISLPQLLICTTVSCLILLAYMVPACLLGAKSGLSFVSLSKPAFGTRGSQLVSANLVLIFMGWYGVLSLWLADGLQGLFHWSVPLAVASFCCALVMATNNLFGFRGVANFARFFAAPVIICWVLFTFFKSVSGCPVVSLLHAPEHVSTISMLTTISTFVLGFAVWGNEPDYWRYAKPKVGHCAIPLMLAAVIGEIIFPATGWLVANATGITETAAATAFMNNYSFGSMSILLAAVLISIYFAPTDSGLFALTTAIRGHFSFRHKLVVMCLALAGGSLAAFMSCSGTAKALESLCELNAIILPPPMIVMLVEWYMQRGIWKMPAFFEQTYESLPDFRWGALVAVAAGIGVGIATSGLIPGLQSLHIGIPPLQGWATTAVVYFVLNAISPGMPIEKGVIIPCDHLKNS